MTWQRTSRNGSTMSDLDEEEWNQSHQIVIVAAELDDSTERITKYLSDEGVSVNVLVLPSV